MVESRNKGGSPVLDSAIVDLYWQRSDAAIAETEKKYGAYCRSLAYGILNDREDSEECVNDTWLRAWNAMPDQRPDRLCPFLGKITRRLALNRQRDQRRLKRGGGERDLCLEELADCIPARAEDAQTRLEAEELSRALDRFLAGLDPLQRDLFVGRYWYLAPIAEIAEKGGLSQGRVKTILFRLRRRLRDYLEKEELL